MTEFTILWNCGQMAQRPAIPCRKLIKRHKPMLSRRSQLTEKAPVIRSQRLWRTHRTAKRERSARGKRDCYVSLRLVTNMPAWPGNGTKGLREHGIWPCTRLGSQGTCYDYQNYRQVYYIVDTHETLTLRDKRIGYTFLLREYKKSI